LSPEESPFVMLIHDPSAFLVLVASFTFGLFNLLKSFIWFSLYCFKRIKKQKKQTIKKETNKQVKEEKIEKQVNEETQKVNEFKEEKIEKVEEDSWSEYSDESNSDEEKVCPCHLE
jgi:predicted membrane protein